MKDGRFDRLPIPLDPDDIDLDETAGSEPDDLPGGQALDLSVSPRQLAVGGAVAAAVVLLLFRSRRRPPPRRLDGD